MGYIYKIYNNCNSKLYIGLTTKEHPRERFSQHKYIASHPNERNYSLIHKAMNKYGIDNFHFEIIEEVKDSELNDREQYWINFYNSKIPNGYNVTEGGEGTVGYSRPQSVEERLKRQKSNKQFYIDHPEEAAKLGERTKKLWENPEYREKVIAGNKKYWEEHKGRFSGENNPFYGKHHSEETLKVIKEQSMKRAKKIAQLDKDTLEVIQVYDGIKDAERALNVSHGWLSKAAKQNKIAYGYRWKFL